MEIEWKLKTDFSAVAPDYKSLPTPWSRVLTPTRLLQVKIGPEDNTDLERHYREHLRGRNERHGVGWEHQFWLDVDGELDVARPLFQSVGGFCKLERALRT